MASVRTVEKRIYVIVAETVDTPEKGTIVQVPGRMAAQGGHALSRMKMHRLAGAADDGKKSSDLFKMADEKITTIWKACRDSDELQHIADNLDRVRVAWYDFEDENIPLYGVYHPRTALATFPIDPKRIEGVTDYLPLWKPEEQA
jgi:hypothetical protein